MSVPRIRRARPADADAVADVWLRSFTAALPSVRRAHDDDDVREFVRTVLVGREETWVLDLDGQVVAMMTLGPDSIEQLYLDPDVRGRRWGDLLVAHAQQQRPAGLTLWTFQVNGPARRFYARHGFVEDTWTDGRDNEEHEPDVRMSWRSAAR